MHSFPEVPDMKLTSYADRRDTDLEFSIDRRNVSDRLKLRFCCQMVISKFMVEKDYPLPSPSKQYPAEHYLCALTTCLSPRKPCGDAGGKCSDIFMLFCG
ncbi:hypothetical protein RRG08_062314 [Elysia crispata]|uniref:Uncharacterized protein n=1 Tax=Elysia crispata TaxID=231223 RepID=A0AAE1CYT2_9GAST|nr:hypothetical protein RRG08_062314 [Elysia crispata]